MILSKIEQETIFSFNNEEETAVIHTAAPSWIRKLDKYVSENPKEFQCVEVQSMEGKVISKDYKVPKKLISVRSHTKKKVFTDEQKKVFSERMKEHRNTF